MKGYNLSRKLVREQVGVSRLTHQEGEGFITDSNLYTCLKDRNRPVCLYQCPFIFLLVDEAVRESVRMYLDRVHSRAQNRVEPIWDTCIDYTAISTVHKERWHLQK